MCLWCREEFLNTLPPGRIPLVLLIKISLKRRTRKKEEAEHKKGASFVSLSLGFSPESAEPVNNDRGFVSRLGEWGGGNSCTLSSCLNIVPSEPFMHCGTWPVTDPSSCTLPTQYPRFLAPIVLTGQARWNQFLSPFQPLSSLTFSCLQFFSFHF